MASAGRPGVRRGVPRQGKLGNLDDTGAASAACGCRRAGSPQASESGPRLLVQPYGTGGAVGSWTRAAEAGTSVAVIRRMAVRHAGAHRGRGYPRRSGHAPLPVPGPCRGRVGRGERALACGSAPRGGAPGRTPVEAPDAGTRRREVWWLAARCMDVPEERRHGLDSPPAAPDWSGEQVRVDPSASSTVGIRRRRESRRGAAGSSRGRSRDADHGCDVVVGEGRRVLRRSP